MEGQGEGYLEAPRGRKGVIHLKKRRALGFGVLDSRSRVQGAGFFYIVMELASGGAGYLGKCLEPVFFSNE